ncbi:probable serine/threonine-protein kinase DDB_G0282963 [Macrosteles quadrilineatus]|uniref:probable serine/threonine-protein kinase DDB_G0282963 n=1 Tax=Macrosteles quadrilineatus TaxID=74068 RepID=UPI0023E255AB|nr:probable serine/threonine-protein kinase DDB_G0282963 [Macrosteles quadrilineatus]
MGAVKRLKRVKNVEWEKNRRERLNLTFFELGRLLPDHDPTLTLTKLEILNKSISYVKELRERNASLLGTNCNEVLGAEMMALREQVKDLQRRNKQLTELLQTAKISLPPRPLRQDAPLTYQQKWEGKLSADADPKKVSETETKENPVKVVQQVKPSLKKKSSKANKSKTKEIKTSNRTKSVSEKSSVNSSNNPLRELNKTLSVQSASSQCEPEVLNSLSNPVKIINNSKVQNGTHSAGKISVSVKSTATPTSKQNSTESGVQNTLVLSRTVTLPGTTISIVLSNPKTNIVTVAKSNVLPTPIMATGIQPVLQCNPTLSSLGPGTLIMPGGRIVPVPPPPTVLAPTLILLPTTTTTTTRPPQKPPPTSGGLRAIVPKPRHRDITKTTFANKVPIPAISTHRHRSETKPTQNNPTVNLAIKNDVKKKPVVNKVNKEKCSQTIVVNKLPSNKSMDNPTVSHLKEGHVELNKNLSGNMVADSSCVTSKPKQSRVAGKRKCETSNENIKCSKIAKVCGVSDEIISSEVIDKSKNECNSLENNQKLGEKIVDDLVSKAKQDEVEPHTHGKKSNHSESNTSCKNTTEKVSTENRLAEITDKRKESMSSTMDDVRNKTVSNKTADSLAGCISENAQAENINVKQNSATNLNNNFNNDKKNDNIQKPKRDSYTISLVAMTEESCSVTSNSLPKEGQIFEGGNQILPVCTVDDSVNREKNRTAPDNSLDNQNDKNTDTNNIAQSSYNSNVFSQDIQNTPKSSMHSGAQQQFGNVLFNSNTRTDKQQYACASLQTCNSTNKVNGSSIQLPSDLGVDKSETSIQTRSNCNNDAASVGKSSMNNCTSQNKQIQDMNTNKNMCDENKTPPNKSLNLGVKENMATQTDGKDNKSTKDKQLVTGTFSDEACKTLNIHNRVNDQCQNGSSSRNTFSSSDQQHSVVNIYSNTINESLKGPNFNNRSVSYTNSGHNNTNIGNTFFSTQQNLQHPTLEFNPLKNTPVINSDRCLNECSQRISANKMVSVSTNQTNNSFNFQNINSSNNVKLVPDINAQVKNPPNFYANKIYQHQPNLQLHGTKALQNTIPTNENFCFKACSSVDRNASSKIKGSSSTQMHLIHTQNHLTNNLTMNVTKSPFLPNNQDTRMINSLNSNSSLHRINAGIDPKANQNGINASADATKSINYPNQQHSTKSSDPSSKPVQDTMKTSVAQSCKSTQVTSMQINYANNEKHIEESKQQAKQNTSSSGPKKPSDDLKSICDKSLIQDDSQELTSLFPNDRLQTCSDNLFRDACPELRDRNLFMPVSHSYMDEMRLSLPHADFSNDLLSSLQVPNTGQHPESISPTAAFLLAFPLVSTSKNSDLITENEGSDSQHATPTTILQIGNIESTNNDLFHQTALMIENNQNMIKQSKHSDTNKNNTSKQLKDVENFNKFQQMEINELMRNENFARNNCKEKKMFVGLGEQDLFYPCTKKKSNVKTNNYPLPSIVVPNIQEKTFEFSENIVRNNSEENRQMNLNEKKSQTQDSRPQNIFNSSSQPYPYSSFSSGNEFMLPQTNYLSSNNQQGNDSSKSTSLASSNFNVISWTTASITSNTSQMDYTTPYCSYPQKPYSNAAKIQKSPQNFEDQRVKEKPVSNLNALPKFSNFQFNNSHTNQDLVGYPHSNQNDNTSYKPEQKPKKLKTNSQRAPVNWMTTPDVRPLLPDAGVAPVLPDAMFQHQKELDFASGSNNMVMLNSSTNITPFSISTSTSNNTQTFYSNSHFSGVDLQLDFASFPDISMSKPTRSSANIPNNQQNPHHYLWSPSKSSIPMLPHIDSHMIPSTLPTLVGDLALGTTTPSGPVDTFRNMSMPNTSFNIETPTKKFEKKLETQKQITKNNEKDCYPNSERRNNRATTDYCQKTHTHQSTNTSTNFLSVSQLVDHVKTDQNQSLRRPTKPSGTKGNNAQKRNTSIHITDKPKTSNSINSSYHHSNPGMMGNRKFDVGVYQDVQNSGVGFPGTFGNQGPIPSQRSSTHYKGSYSAESLIADQPTPVQGHVSDIPQFVNQYSHPPVVSSSSYPSTDFLHQNVQPLEFNQTQNCFNFPPNSHYSSAPFTPEGDYHLGVDHLFNLTPSSNKHSTSCQTSTKDNRSSVKRNQNKPRREEFTPQWTPQVYSSAVRPKGPIPPHCPPSTSSPSHQGTTTLTNFNLSTIFPEINDKVGLTGPPSSNFPSTPNFRPH